MGVPVLLGTSVAASEVRVILEAQRSLKACHSIAKVLRTITRYALSVDTCQGWQLKTISLSHVVLELGSGTDWRLVLARVHPKTAARMSAGAAVSSGGWTRAWSLSPQVLRARLQAGASVPGHLLSRAKAAGFPQGGQPRQRSCNVFYN